MKTAYFKLSNPQYHSEPMDAGYEKCWVTYRIPILPAYAIASYTIQSPRVNVDGYVTSPYSSINGDVVRVDGVNPLAHVFDDPESTLIINYLGISDYQCFFPHFGDSRLRARAAEFMEEADKTFEEASWLSFVLMAGGVLESFLVDLLGDEESTFGSLIRKVKEKKYFTELELGALKDAAEARNIVHAGKYAKSYVSRDKAMQVRLVLEQLLRKDWFSIKNEDQASE